MANNYLSDENLDALRALVGDEPSDGELEDRYSRLGDIYLVALEVLNRRLTEMIENPASFSVGGEYSESSAANIGALRDQIKAVQLTADRLGVSVGSAVTSVSLSRASRRR